MPCLRDLPYLLAAALAAALAAVLAAAVYCSAALTKNLLTVASKQ